MTLISNQIPNNDFVIQTYYRKDLQNKYGIPSKVFGRWLSPYLDVWGIRNKKYFTPEQVKKIIEQFGAPTLNN